MTQRGESTLWGFVGGLLAGVLLASLYVRYGYQPRNVLTLPAQVTSAAVSMTADADLENWDLSPEVRAVQTARSRVHAYDMAVGKPALREALGGRHGTREIGELKRRMFLSDLQADPFLYGYLARRFPDVQPEKYLDIVLTSGDHGLAMDPPDLAQGLRSSLPR